MPLQQSKDNDELSKESISFIQYFEYHFGLICFHCRNKVLDPDKKKGQTILKGKCPSCGKTSKEEKKTKKQGKKERQELNKACRAKY